MIRPRWRSRELEAGVGVGAGVLEATADKVKVALSPLSNTGSAEKSKVLELEGGLGELGAAIDDDPGTCPVNVIEEKTPGLVAEMLIELIVILAPLLLVTVKAPALEILDPALTLIATVEVTDTLICALAVPPAVQTQANTIAIRKAGHRFTAIPPERRN
jgi:hypothetical protein